ncbi:MAG: hypothetical protein EOO73_23925 [Myxococcales bacterium]|nr:MAG: hypothetical protein EOO73_23925 [Myxococcales bacterium]
MSLKYGWLLALLLGTGCGVFSPKGPTEVARGEYYAAGRPEYDSFFILLHEKQVELLSAPGEPRAAREGLTSALGLTADASDEALAQRLRQELQKLASQGLRVRLELPPPSTALDASATLHASDSIVTTPLRVSLPKEATRLVRARNRMLETKAELEKLRVMGITLEGSVDRAFRTEGPWKRDEVKSNLNDSQKVITLMQSRAGEVEALASRGLAVLGAVGTTDASLDQAVAEPTPAEEPSRSRKRAEARGSARPAGGRPPSTSRPPAPRGDGEAAAPKPVQGSAPAEIEP